ncbi:MULTISPECIES: hypothetical protein [Geobacillus]|uniref:hypothetical protein n=1 Tax=Geobacillus TaxID=129337 RepID=UPI000A9DB2DE|nr:MULTISPECIES: hypothetical protein [Geobacillus]
MSSTCCGDEPKIGKSDAHIAGHKARRNELDKEFVSNIKVRHDEVKVVKKAISSSAD